jgi:hypothetical protein
MIKLFTCLIFSLALNSTTTALVRRWYTWMHPYTHTYIHYVITHTYMHTYTHIHIYTNANIRSCNIIHVYIHIHRSQGSSVSIVSDYGLDDRAIRVRSPAGAEDFSSSLYVQIGSGAHAASCPLGTGVLSPGCKARPGRDADHSPPSSAEVMNELELYFLSPKAPPWRIVGLLYLHIHRPTYIQMYIYIAAYVRTHIQTYIFYMHTYTHTRTFI